MPDKLRILILILILIPLSLTAQKGEEELVEQVLNWEAVSGAWGYEVVIRSGDEEILRQQVEETSITFSLKPGSYEFSISILNKFKKIVNTTPWQSLIIREAFQPVIRDFTPLEAFQRKGENLVIEAKVFQVQADTIFTLIDESGGEIEGLIMYLDEETVRLRFSLDELPPGNYILHAVDASGLADASSAASLTILPLIKPEVRSASPRKIRQREVYQDLVVKGSGFEEGLTARIYRPGQELVPYEIEWLSEDEFRMAMITGEMPPGRYSLEVTNPSGESGSANNIFLMEEAPEMEEVRQIPPTDTFSVLGGYSPRICVGATTGDFEYNPMGFVLKVRQDVVNSVLWKSPGLRYLGWEFSMDFSSQKNRIGPTFYNQLYTGFHFFYQVPLAGGWFLLPKIGLGISNLWINTDKLAGDNLQGEAGFALGTGTSFQKRWRNGVLLEFGLDYRYTIYTGGRFHTIHPWLAGGYRF